MEAFKILNAVSVNEHTERKGKLTYLSWAWAWAEIKKRYPSSYYTVYETPNGMIYHNDGNTAWVKTGVTLVDGEEKLEHIEYLPIMDAMNKSLPLSKITSFDVNKTIQRSLTKACARHGLGLYVYAGEDLPEGDENEEPPKPGVKAAPATINKAQTPAAPMQKTSTIYNPWPEVNKIKERFGVNDDGFNNMRMTLIAGGIIPNIPSKEMKEEDWKQLFSAIEQNFGDVA